MKKNIPVIYIAILVGLVFLAAGILSAADVTAPPADVTIDNQVYKSDKKGPVALSHEKHVNEYNATCTDCHHEYKDGENVWKEGDPVKNCVSCHDPDKAQGDAAKAQTAYHNNCKDCHKESGKDTAPSKRCNDCHSET